MTFTVTNANDVNALLEYVIGFRPTGVDKTDDELCEAARQAAERLAEQAHSVLACGLNAKRVHETWSWMELGPWLEEGVPDA